HRNLELSVKYAREAGMISQAALSITHSPVHTVDYYMDIVDHLVEYGADEICLKDMAGIGRPASLGELVRRIKSKYPGIIVQYHGHSGPGMSVASMLEVARAGADYLDVAMEPLSWGMVHPDVIAIHAVMSDAGFDVPEINMDAYMKVRTLTREFINDFLGLFIDPRNRQMTSLLIRSGLPGGMMGSMMADLKGVHQGINAALKARNKPEMTEDELVVELFREVGHIWPMMGYPPLVTPFSQYVKNVALMNIVSLVNGKERFAMIDPNTWDMLLGRAGTLPGPLAPELIELARKEGKEFYEGNPQDNYPDALDTYRKEMEENGWPLGPDDEELFELAMHDRQYRDYKSGMAQERFLKEIADKQAELSKVAPAKMPRRKLLLSPETGTAFLYSGETATYWPEEEMINPGEKVRKGEIVMYIMIGKTIREVVSDRAGTVKKILVRSGDKVNKGDPLIEFS
ncbi:MAG TPA: oxaloacetate decarboxylase, partial [Bacteroidales bacterium]|nr:oxaloacetate decarboxylase [Bacteroidales bacterium]